MEGCICALIFVDQKSIFILDLGKKSISPISSGLKDITFSKKAILVATDAGGH